MVGAWWSVGGMMRWWSVMECWGVWWSVGEYGGVVGSMKGTKKRVCFCFAHSYIYNFLASYGSLEEDDPNRYLIDLST